MKERTNNKELLINLENRFEIIEKKFNIKMSEEDRDLWNDARRDLIVPLETLKDLDNQEEIK